MLNLGAAIAQQVPVVLPGATGGGHAITLAISHSFLTD
jgi:hypothetical protein